MGGGIPIPQSLTVFETSFKLPQPNLRIRKIFGQWISKIVVTVYVISEFVMTGCPHICRKDILVAPFVLNERV